MSGRVVDAVLVVLIVFFAISGYRQGLILGSLSFMGFFGGALLGLQLEPVLAPLLHGELARVILSLVLVFGIAIGGYLIADWAGHRLHNAISSQVGRRVDAIGGIFVSVVSLLIVAWMMAVPLGSSTLPSLNRAIRGSAILGGVDRVMPDQAQVFYNGLRQTIAAGDFPNVLGGLTPTRVPPVDPPDPALATAPVVAAVEPSIVKITGTAPSCQQQLQGSGFVFAPERVLTNAHVVAGTRGAVTVQAGNAQLDGTVVSFDPARDLAVIYVPGLTASPLPWADATAASGDDAIVVGFPHEDVPVNGDDSPFTATAARIRDRIELEGPDIYNETVDRDVYTIRATVHRGNSGGPLIDAAGEVLGVVFAASLDDPDTGFVLTDAEVESTADAATGATAAVSTGRCT